MVLTINTDHAWSGMGVAAVAMALTRLGFVETFRQPGKREHQPVGKAQRGSRTMARSANIVLKNDAGPLWLNT